MSLAGGTGFVWLPIIVQLGKAREARKPRHGCEPKIDKDELEINLARVLPERCFVVLR